jgi:predicted transcriptional regulator
VPKKPSRAASSSTPTGPAAQPLERIARLLAVVAVKDMERNEKIQTLMAAGFSRPEIAELLGISQNVISGVVFRDRRG